MATTTKDGSKRAADKWLSIGRSAFNQSTTYMDNNYRKQWQDSIHHFQGRHVAGSKYHKPSYKYRSKLFRPKSRAAVRNNEAAAMAAFFSNLDAVSLEPVNANNDQHVVNAEVAKQVLQMRLENDIPWFLTVMGAYQDAQVVGVVCSYQSWCYQEMASQALAPVVDEAGQPMVDEDGKPLVTTVQDVRVIEDRPDVTLLPVEYIRIHPAADWRDPINSSPYVIRLVPMYVADLKARMKKPDPKTGHPRYRELTDGEIMSAVRQSYDPTRSVREQNRQDKLDNPDTSKELFDYDICWVHEIFLRKDGEDLVFYTLGNDFRLTDPQPIEEVYFHGERPIVMGCVVIEAHKIYPNGVVGIAADVQKEINENVNQRLDNVKLVLNKRYITRRGSQVDIPSLVRNVAGSVTMATDPDGDIKILEWNDVTSSAYAEQDRLNLDFDDVAGSFSSSTIQSNRQMNETVGGMSMLRGETNLVREYGIRTFAETWAQPVLKQLLKLIQMYETDQRILTIAGEKAKQMVKYNMDVNLDEALDQELVLRVNVGMGATDPLTRLNLVLQGMRAVTEILAQPLPGLNPQEVVKEIFGRLGFPDGGRFFNFSEDNIAMQAQAMIQQLQQQLQEVSQQLKDKRAELDTKILLERMEQQGEDRRQARELAHEAQMKRIEVLNQPERTGTDD
jgi:hypothetical protein